MFETLLGILDGDEANTRIELVQVASPGEQATLELRMQRDGGDLGWVTQRRIRMAPGQIGQLRTALSLMDRDAQVPAPAPAGSNVVVFPGRLAG